MKTKNRISELLDDERRRELDGWWVRPQPFIRPESLTPAPKPRMPWAAVREALLMIAFLGALAFVACMALRH